MDTLEEYSLWAVAPHLDRVAEFREQWPQDDYRMRDLVLVTAEAMLAGDIPVPERFLVNRYGGDSPLSADVFRRTLEYMSSSNLTSAPPPELLTAWLVDGVLRWHPQKALPTHMEPRVTAAEVAQCVAECDRPMNWPRQFQKHALYLPTDVETLGAAVTARKVERFVRDNRMQNEVKRLLGSITDV